MKIKFLIADDHPMVREGVISLLKVFYEDAEYFEASSVTEARDCLDSTTIDCALLDYKMGAEHVITLLPYIQRHHPNTKMLVFSMMDDREIGSLCIKAGAHGFLQKASHPDEVLVAVQTVLSGRIYASIDLSKKLMSQENRKEYVDSLTKREVEVFSHIGQGLKVSEIAECLGVSVKTVEAHRENIKNKLCCDTAAQLTVRAAKWLDECQ